MNPASASAPTVPRPVVNDIGRPVAATVEAPAQAQMAPAQMAAPTLVSNIPVHAQDVAATPPPAVNEDIELDQIMRDVSHEVKNIQKKKKSGMLSFLHREPKPKPAQAPTAAQGLPIHSPQPMPANLNQMPAPAAVPPAQTAQVSQQTQPAAPAKPHKSAQAPIFAILVALLITGFLAAAAIAAYRQS
jgi:hypothetical protein